MASENAHQYQSYYGLTSLRNEFSVFYKKHFDASLNPENEILPLIGSKEGIMHISMSFLNQGDEVLVPNPAYPAYRTAALLAGAKVISYDLKEELNWLADIKKLEKQNLSKVKIMWLNYPNMPTGANAPLHYFKTLLNFAKKHNILLCHDNPYAFILNNKPLSILGIEGAKENALELTSLSKSFHMAGWRIGAVLGHKNYIETIVKFKSNMDSGMFKPIQLAAQKAIQLNDEWFKNLNSAYAKRKVEACKIFDYLKCSYNSKSAGLFVWAKVPNKNGQEWSDFLLANAKVFITPGFIFGTNGVDYLRISLCSSEENFESALERIKEVI